MQHTKAKALYHSQYSFPFPPGTHYYWVARGGVDSKLAQGFYTRLAPRESNPRPLDLGSYALTTRPRAPLNGDRTV